MYRRGILPNIFLFFVFLAGTCLTPALAAENELGIDVREIIQRLTRVEEGIKHLNQRIDDQNQRIDDQNQRIDDMKTYIDTRMTDLQAATDKRLTDLQTSTNKQFDAVNQRISDLSATMLTMFTALIALMVALFGYIAWDRRTMFRPLKERQEKMEAELKDIKEDVREIQEHLGVQRGAARSKPDQGSDEILNISGVMRA